LNLIVFFVPIGGEDTVKKFQNDSIFPFLLFNEYK